MTPSERRGARSSSTTSRKSFEDGRIAALADVSFRARARASSSRSPGRPGCGKSTLLNLIGALDRPDAGTITVGGERLERSATRREYRAATVGFVFQFHNLIPTLTAAENVQVPMLGRGLGRVAREQRALRAARRGAALAPRDGLAGDALRRRAPARRDRAGARERAAAPARRRADRRARLGDRRADRRAAAARSARSAGRRSCSSRTTPTVAGAADRTCGFATGGSRTAPTPAAAPRSASA